ncbi:MAG: 16S rRNA processing protein RimM [Alphaproteobacteria bacterium]|nr:MAG: 16S rRNA processing protein RimM [Alphaproteobacteria bacterium]
MKHILVGQIIKLHGVKGLLKLKPYTEEDFFSYTDFFDENQKVLKLIYKAHVKDHLLIEIEGVNSLVKAKSYVGMKIYSTRKELAEDEFYFDDLVGLPVYNEEGILEGRIERVQDFRASPFLVIKTPSEKLVNAFFHREAIIEISDNKVVLQKSFILN